MAGRTKGIFPFERGALDATLSKNAGIVDGAPLLRIEISISAEGCYDHRRERDGSNERLRECDGRGGLLVDNA